MTNPSRLRRPGRAWRKTIYLVIFALLLGTANGQTQPASSITVNVKDSSGAAVVGAAVKVTSKDTGRSITQQTDDAGIAVFDGLLPGIYDVTVEASGFTTLTWRTIDLNAKRTAVLDVELDIGDPRDIKLLTAEGLPVIPTEEGVEELSALPNLNNDLTPLLQIVPGAVAAGPSSLGRIIVDGRGLDQQTTRLDGVDFTPQVDFPTADSAINPVGSFQKPEVAGDLDSSATRSGAFGFEPRHGPGTGVVSEAATYRASDQFFAWRAQFYGEHRNDALNARNFFDSDGENAIRRTRFGGKAGGPLPGSNRAFLFLAYDGWRGRTERNVYEAVPAEAATGGAAGPLAPHLRAFLPPGTHLVPGASLNSDFVVARRRTRTTVESNAWDARLDFYPYRPKGGGVCPNTDAPKECSPLNFRFTHQTAENHVPDGVTGRSQRQRFFFVNALAGWRLLTHTKKVRNELEAKRRTNEFGHHFRFGFNLTRAHMDTETVAPTSSDLAQSLIAVGGTGAVAGLPLPPALPDQPRTIPVAALGGLIRGTGRGLDLKPISYSASYDFSRPFKDDKRHELYAGFEARFLRLDFDRLGGLTYSFPDVAALRAGTPGSVTFQSDLSGPSPFSTGVGRRSARQQYYMGYIQMVSQFPPPCELKPGEKPPSLVIRVPQPGQQPEDEPRCNENQEPALTLTYGLRYDYFSRVRENDARAVVVDPLTGQILPQGAPFYRIDKVNIQPRFGLAYRPANEGSFKNTMIRAGVGLYSGVPRIGDLTLPIDSDRFSTGVTGGTFPASPTGVIRGFVENPLTRQFQPLAFARDYSPLERALKWDVRVGHLHGGYEFSAYYIGNVGRNLALANITNRIERVVTNPDPARPAIVVREFDVVRDGLVFQPFGEFFYRLGGGRSSYNALALQISRDSKDELSTRRQWLKLPVKNFNAKYTLSRSVGNASGTIMSNPLDPDADFGHNSGVARHSFTLSAVYDLWMAPESARNINNILWGWKIMPSLKATSGLPLVVRINRPDVVYVDAAGSVFASPAAGRTAILNTPGGGSSGGAFVPDVVSGVNPLARNGIEILNPAAFAIPAPGQLGNAQRGQFRGPAVFQFDLGIRRNFPLPNREKMSGEFQVDIFNLFNRANFINPAASLPGLLGTNAGGNQLQPGVPFTRAAAGNFGVATAADPGRLIQFSFTVRFNKGFTK